MTRTAITASSLLALLMLCVACGAGSPSETADAPPALAASESPANLQPLVYANWETVPPGAFSDFNQRASLVQRGHAVYKKYCIGCHGELGDGRGPAAERLLTRPRDFTSGIYKFRSTDSGSLPMESDLYRTITNGLSRVSMPAFPLVPVNEKIAVIEYIKGFYPNWEGEKQHRKLVHVPLAPDDLTDPERVLRGRVVYLEMECGQCHGHDGQGTGATRTEYVDAWGDPQKPFNFTRGSLKGGNAPEDIYRTFHTGLRSVMPSYDGDTMATANAEGLSLKRDRVPDANEFEQLLTVVDQFPATADVLYTDMSQPERRELGVRNSWDLVSYIMSLRQTITTRDAVLGTWIPGGASGSEE